MLKILRSVNGLSYSMIMEVYGQSLRLAAEKEYPQKGENAGLLQAEQDYYAYLRDVHFLLNGAFMAVWEEKGVYISAVRVEPYQDGVLITGLETRSDFRNQGYATMLLRALTARCNAGEYPEIISHIDDDNVASIAVHTKCGFQKIADHAAFLDGTVSHIACTMRYCPPHRR